MCKKKKATLKNLWRKQKNQKSFQKDIFCLDHFVNARTTRAHDNTTLQRLKLLHTITALASNGKARKMARQTKCYANDFLAQKSSVAVRSAPTSTTWHSRRSGRRKRNSVCHLSDRRETQRAQPDPNRTGLDDEFHWRLFLVTNGFWFALLPFD